MEIEQLYLGVTVRLKNGTNYTFVNAKQENCRVWRENGFYYIDDGGPMIHEITQGNVRQASFKRPEPTPITTKVNVEDRLSKKKY